MPTPAEVKTAIQEGRLGDALTTIKQAVRDNPEDPANRIALFELFSIEGDWKRAEAQLAVVANLGQKDFADIFGKVLAGEAQREGVLRGEAELSPLRDHSPVWLHDLFAAMQALAAGKQDEADSLRAKVFETAPRSKGIINKEPFEVIGDADSRFGPALEMILDGSYLWVPFEQIQRVDIEAPTNLRDLVWVPALVTLTTDQPRKAYLPVRYPGTVTEGVEDALKLSRKTEWIADEAGPERGIGQRLIATDKSDYPLLEINHIAVEHETES